MEQVRRCRDLVVSGCRKGEEPIGLHKNVRHAIRSNAGGRLSRRRWRWRERRIPEARRGHCGAGLELAAARAVQAIAAQIPQMLLALLEVSVATRRSYRIRRFAQS